MVYLVLKHLHVACVILSICGFCLRGFLLMRKSALARWHDGRSWLRALPHVNDSLLLAAALGLVALLGQYPFVDAWLTAKVMGLLAYIILGALALKPGRPASVRIAAAGMALAVFGWIVSVALSKHPDGFLVIFR
jgi:uncharacterized membrane protein SirB2